MDTLKKTLYNLGDIAQFSHTQLTQVVRKMEAGIPPPHLVSCAVVICPGICAVRTYHSQEAVRYGVAYPKAQWILRLVETWKGSFPA